MADSPLLTKSKTAIAKQANAQAGMLVHNYNVNVKGIAKKVIYHFSDIHLSEYDSFSDEQEKLFAIERTNIWEERRVAKAKHYKEPCSEEQLQSSYQHFVNLLAEAEKGDALILTGDICDYISGANIRAVNNCFSKLTIPYMYVCGNHEKPELIPDGNVVSQIKNPVQILDLGDVVIFGVDNSRRQVTAEQTEQLKRAFLLGKPLIVAMHVPIMTDGNQEEFEKRGAYVQFNGKDAGKETLEFVDLIKENANSIIAVLAGHLHYIDNTQVVPGVMQYVSSQGILGNINRYEIGI